MLEAAKAKDDQIDFLRARVKYLEEKRYDKQESSPNKRGDVRIEKEASVVSISNNEIAQMKTQFAIETDRLKCENNKLNKAYSDLQREKALLAEKLLNQVI